MVGGGWLEVGGRWSVVGGWLVVAGWWWLESTKCCACHANHTGTAAATQERARAYICYANHTRAEAATQEHQGVHPTPSRAPRQLVGDKWLVAIGW